MRLLKLIKKADINKCQVKCCRDQAALKLIDHWLCYKHWSLHCERMVEFYT